MLFLTRQVRTRLDLLHPDVETLVHTKQSEQKFHHDKHARGRQLCVGQRVMAKSSPPGSQWIPGTIIRRTGPLSFQVQVSDGRI